MPSYRPAMSCCQLTLALHVGAFVSLCGWPGIVSAAEPPASHTLAAEHGVVCRLPGERCGYFGWPAVARTDDGRLYTVCYQRLVSAGLWNRGTDYRKGTGH